MDEVNLAGFGEENGGLGCKWLENKMMAKKLPATCREDENVEAAAVGGRESGWTLLTSF